MAKKEETKEIEHKKSSHNNDVIQIPVGKWFSGAKRNPWMPATVVLAIVVVLMFIFGSGMPGTSVSESTAGANLVSFISAQGQGTAEVVSTKQVDGFYEITVNYQGQDIPVYVSLDGKYLISDRIPLTGDVIETGGSTGSNERVEIETGDAPFLGSASATVTIVEFTDYECPFCGRHYTESYKKLKTEYVDTGKVKYVIMDYPLSFHPNAQKAAEAARCVRDQKGDSGYFMMHDKLFENQQSLSEENYKKWARELGANGATFDSCLDSGKYSSAVQEDLAYGSQLGVQGTPASYINGLEISGAQPYSVFKQIIDQELAA